MGWSIKNPNVAYDKNPEGVITGARDDTKYEDVFYWSAAELLLATKSEEFAVKLVKSQVKWADDILAVIENNPYNIALERYEWGLKSDILN